MSEQTHQDQDRQSPHDQRQDDQDPWLHRGRRIAEWVSLGVSLLVVLGAAGYLGYEALTQADAPIPITAEAHLDQARAVEDGFEVPMEIHNRGSQTVRNLQLRVTVQSGQAQPTELDFVIDYLGQGEKKTIRAFIKQPPQGTSLTIEPRLYEAE